MKHEQKILVTLKTEDGPEKAFDKCAQDFGAEMLAEVLRSQWPVSDISARSVSYSFEKPKVRNTCQMLVTLENNLECPPRVAKDIEASIRQILKEAASADDTITAEVLSFVSDGKELVK